MSVPRLFHASEGVRLLVGLEIGLAGRGVIEGPRGRLDGDLRFLHSFILRNAQGLGRLDRPKALDLTLLCGKRGKRRLLEIEPPK